MVKQFSKGDITIMRESFNFKGFKRKVDTIAEADQLVLSYHPSWKGIREGSLGHWTWYLVDEIIAEAWLHQKFGWWLKIKIVDIT
ncbi:hypothetical protein [Nostoc sp.]